MIDLEKQLAESRAAQDALRVERDEAVAHLDAIKAKTKPMLDECVRNSEIAQQTVDAAHAEVARVHAEWGADIERIAKAELLSAAERLTRRAAEARAEGAIAAQAKAEQERWQLEQERGEINLALKAEMARADAAGREIAEAETLLDCIEDVADGSRPTEDFEPAEGVLRLVCLLRRRADAAEAERDAARAEAEGLREALKASLWKYGHHLSGCYSEREREHDCDCGLYEIRGDRAATGAQPRPAECEVVTRVVDDGPRGEVACGAPLPCAEHPTSKEGK